jgi:hypothetical protein
MAMKPASFNWREVVAALVIVALGLFMAMEAQRYPFGVPQRMGPGFFPVVLGFLLVGLGTAIAIEVRRTKTSPVPNPIRPFVMIIGGIVAFALILPRWGLLPATAALVLLSAAGDRPFRPVAACGTALVLVIGGYLLFVKAFGLPLSLLRW